MPIRIYLPEDVAEGKDVVLVDGQCFERVGPSSVEPTVLDAEEVYVSCEACESSNSSSSGSSDSDGGGGGGSRPPISFSIPPE